MSPTASLVPVPTRTVAHIAEGRRPWPIVAASGALAILLLINVPAFLCMGLDSDISMYDLVARRVLSGDVHYRDLLETNFPGIVWLHIAFRTLFGASSIALRAVDLALVSLSAWLLARWLPRTTPAWGRLALVTLFLTFYLSTSEWCHCQRDTWMLLPALIALNLRARQAERIASPNCPLSAVAGWAGLEAMLWAMAFWIKPFVAVPGAACWLIAARQARNDNVGAASFKRRLAVDLGAFLAGGLIVIACGVGWLVATGAWPAFVEVMFVWNREYFAYHVSGEGPWTGLVGFLLRFCPWALVHVAAVPVACAALWRGSRREMSVPPLLAGFYLAWLLQAVLLQHLFDYVHVPPILLGIAVLAVYGFSRATPETRLPITAIMLLLIAARYPALIAQRGGAWMQCVNEGSTAAVRDRVTLLHRVNWADLELVAEFLRDEGLRDGELTNFSLPTVALYEELDLAPSTRYIFLQDHLDIFARRRSIIEAALVNSRQKVLVCDLGRYNMDRVREALEESPADESHGVGEWRSNGVTERTSSTDLQANNVAFRAGNYVVFRLTGPEMPAWLRENF